MQSLGDILHHQQIKQLISRLVPFELRDFASTAWFRQDEALQKLNLQLHVNAIMKNDEFVLEECIALDKFRLLIVDLIVSSTWKERVLPLLLSRAGEMNSMKVYLAVYHESVMCNVLEVLMFHRTAVEESGDMLIEVIDYCYRKVSRRVVECVRLRGQKQQSLSEQQMRKKKVESILRRTPAQQLSSQISQVQFNLFIMSISILRYVTDYIKYLQIGIVHHLLVECNVYGLLVPLIEERPWMRQGAKGEREIFEGGKWTVVEKGQYGRLPKTEAQVWIALYNLFMDPECRKKYELNDERKNNLLRLRKYMNEVLLDQIPPLSQMLRALQQLSLMNVPTHLSVSPFVVQQMPIIAGQITKGVDWKQMAEEHFGRLSKGLDEGDRQHIQRLADLYTNNTVEGLMEGFKCGGCGKQAFKRCAKCKGVWYCSRECQVKEWPGHKEKCNKVVKEFKQGEEKRKQGEVKGGKVEGEGAGAKVGEEAKRQLIDELD